MRRTVSGSQIRRRSGRSDARWRDADTPPAPPPQCDPEAIGALSSVLPNGTAPQRALGPPWTPMATSPSVLRERDYWRPHLCTQVRIVTPETGSRRFGTERQSGNKEGERAGIEPARPPAGQGQLDAVRAVRSTHTVAFDDAPLAQPLPRPPSRARASRGARVTIASDDAQVWMIRTAPTQPIC